MNSMENLMRIQKILTSVENDCGDLVRMMESAPEGVKRGELGIGLDRALLRQISLLSQVVELLAVEIYRK